MILILSPYGGPIQYVGLILFVLRFLPLLDIDINPITICVLSLLIFLCVVAYGCYLGTWSRVIQSIPVWFRDMWRSIQSTTGISSNSGKTILLLGVTGVIGTLVVNGSFDFLFTICHMVIGFFMLRAQMGLGDEGDHNYANQRPISEIIEIVQKMPIEEFVSEEQIKSSCSIQQLKKLLSTRGISGDDCNKFLERQELVDALCKCRNYSETCCICYEDYNEGDAIRVLPKCRHEFHVECVDQWAYTFANKSTNQVYREPSCPLCKVAL